MTSVDRIQGLSGQQAIKTPCRLATTAAITLSGEQTIDGVAAVEGDRVLVKNQTDTSTNGVYDVSTGGWTRSIDFDGANDIADGTMVLVGSGNTNADLVFKLNATEPITIDTTALTFTVAASFTDISAFGATLLDDANAAAARTTLGLGTAATASSGDFQPADEQLTELAAINPAQGDIIYYNGTDWVKLAAGTSGQFLKTQGAGANPTWATQTLPTGYTSAAQAVTSAGTVTLTHGLGATPRLIDLTLECQADDQGYTTGQVIQISADASAASSLGVSVIRGATDIVIRYGSGANVFQYPRAATGVVDVLDNTKWKLVVRAWV